MIYTPNKCEVIIIPSTDKLEEFLYTLSTGDFEDTEAFIYLEDNVSFSTNFYATTTIINSGAVHAHVKEFIDSLDSLDAELDRLVDEKLLILIQHNDILKLNKGLTQKMINITNKVKGSGAHFVLIASTHPTEEISGLFENITAIK